MSKLKKRNKIDINFYSTGNFLNLDKPKLLSIDKSEKNNLKKIKKTNHNISEDISYLETITKQTENSSKDEIIKVLKERLTILENKVKILEKENNDNIKKINLLNLSNGHIDEKKRIGFIHNKLNLKLGKNKSQKKILNILNLSRNIDNDNSKKIYKRNSCFNSFEIVNNNNYINNKQNNKINFINIFNVNNTNELEKKINFSSYKYKTKNNLLIPKKKLLFEARFKRSFYKASSVDLDNVKNNVIKIDCNKNIPKIPRKRKQIGSEINNQSICKYNYKIKYNPDDYNNFELKRSNSEKKKEFVFINNNNINKNFIIDFNVNEINNNKFNLIKNKLENIKERAKNLLYYYSSNNTNTDNK